LYYTLNRLVTRDEAIAYALYPKEFLVYQKIVEQYGNLSVFDTPTFLYGMRPGDEVEVEIEKGKTLIVKLVSIGQAQPDGIRTVYFELNGQPREVIIKDDSIKTTVVSELKADSANPNHLGATMPGKVIKVLVQKGEKVSKGDHLIITEAMKMETTIQAPSDGIVRDTYLLNGEAIQPGDLLIELQVNE
jgi:pyruvate carboxylase